MNGKSQSDAAVPGGAPAREGEAPAGPGQPSDRWFALAAVALPILVLFGPLLVSDRLPAMRDAGHYYYALFQWCTDQWAAGRAPLWNPLENCGTPVHADPTASLWYPGKLIFALPLDFAVRFKLYVVLHVVLCAATSWWLARRWGASIFAAALAALSYSGGGSVVFQHCNIVYLVGAAWLPVAVGFLDDTLRRRKVQSAAWLGVVLALIILGGDPQLAYHVLLLGALLAVIWIGSRSHAPAREGEAPAEPPRPRTATGADLFARLGLLAAAAVVALLLAAVQILPSAAATATSERATFDAPRSIYEAAGHLGAGSFAWSQCRTGLLAQPKVGSHHDTVYDFSIAPWRLAELVWPNCGGRMFPTHRRWLSLLPSEGRIWTPTLYLGLLPLVLGLSALRLRGVDPRARWLSWIVLIFTLGSFGSFGLGWLARQVSLFCGGTAGDFAIGDPVGGVYWLFVVLLPKYVYFRYPAKLLVVASLGISQLAAMGWDRAVAAPRRGLVRMLVLLGVGSGIAAVGAIIAAQFVVLGEGQASAAFGPFDNRGAWTDIITSLVHTSLVAIVSGWLLQANGKRKPLGQALERSRIRQAALLALCAAELALANYWLTPTAPASLWRGSSAIAQAINSDDGSPRIYRAPAWWPKTFQRSGSAARLEEMVAWERQTLAGRYALLDRVAAVNAQVGLKRADHEALLDAADLAGSDREAQRAALERLGANYLILPADTTPDFAQALPSNSLPADTVLWRTTDSPQPIGEPIEYRLDLAPFVRGAAISVVSWALLVLLLVVASMRTCLAAASTRRTGRGRPG